MRTYIRLLGSGASVLIGLGATMIVQGGWQAVAAAFAIFGGLVFAMTFISLGVRAERPPARRTSSARSDQRVGHLTHRVARDRKADPGRLRVAELGVDRGKGRDPDHAPGQIHERAA
jgi:hypothetical protein